MIRRVVVCDELGWLWLTNTHNAISDLLCDVYVHTHTRTQQLDVLAGVIEPLRRIASEIFVRSFGVTATTAHTGSLIFLVGLHHVRPIFTFSYSIHSCVCCALARGLFHLFYLFIYISSTIFGHVFVLFLLSAVADFSTSFYRERKEKML